MSYKRPTFLCIGAQKCGTTWLTLNLRKHPDVWIPPVKALNYFNNKTKAPMILAAASDFLPTSKPYTVLRRYIRDTTTGRLRASHFWYWRYFFLPRTDRWYASLFAPAGSRICGEATPAYARLGEEDVRRICAGWPSVKIIYLIRDPIERVWSQTAMQFHKKGISDISNVSPSQLSQVLNRENVSLNSSYADILQTWRECFGEENVFVGFFDRLREDSRSFFKDICRFLQVRNADDILPRTLSRPRNRRSYPSIPPAIEAHLAAQFGEEIDQLHQIFNNSYTKAWLEHAERALSGSSIRIQAQERLRESAKEYAEWHKKNPEKRFGDFYAETVGAQIEQGKRHVRLTPKQRLHILPKSEAMPLSILVEHFDLKPEHTVVDYGCGALSDGVHFIQYLEPKKYWGVDVTDTFMKSAINHMDPQVLRVKQPRFDVISPDVIERIAKSRPDFVFSNAVLLHVPPFELDDYLEKILHVTTGNTTTLIKARLSEETIQTGKRSWSYPKQMLEEKIALLGGVCSWLENRCFWKPKIDVRLTSAWLAVTRSEPLRRKETTSSL